jgi:hypothetical protein
MEKVLMARMEPEELRRGAAAWVLYNNCNVFVQMCTYAWNSIIFKLLSIYKYTFCVWNFCKCTMIT